MSPRILPAEQQRFSFTGSEENRACLESNNTSRPNNFWNAPPFPIKRSESELVRVRLQILSIEVTTEVACNSSCSAFLKELKLKVIFSVFRDTKQRLQHRIHHHYPLQEFHLKVLYDHCYMMRWKLIF